MGFFSLVGISTTISNMIMACITLYAGRRTIHIVWVCFCLCVSILGYFLTKISFAETPEDALIFWRLAYIGVINIPVLILHTTFLILKLDFPWRRGVLGIAYLVTLFFHIANISGHLLENVSYLFNEIYFDTPYNSLFVIFFGFFNIIFFTIFYLLYKAYKREYKEERKRIGFFSTGIAIGVIGGGALFLPVFHVPIYPYTAILTGVYPLVIGYSILYHHLFDGRYAALQILRMLMIITSALLVGGGLWIGAENYLGYTPKIHPIELGIWVSMYLTGIFLYDSNRFSRFFLVSSLSILEDESQKFIEKPGVYKNMEDLLGELEKIFDVSLQIKKVEVMSSVMSMKYPHILRYFYTYKKPLVRSELESEQVEGENALLFSEVTSLGETIFPLDPSGSGDIYFLILGKKGSSEYMTERELTIISRIIPKISLSLQVLDFHQSLQNEVRTQTRALNHKNKELEIAYEKLQRADRNKDSFLAIASHELRTPMTIIKGYTDLFLHGTFGSLGEDARSHMQKIYASTDSLIELVNTILDISKIEAGKFEIVKKEIIFGEVIARVKDNFSTLYQEKGIELSLTNKAKSTTIFTDESKLTIILTNLLSNAYKFTNTGGRVDIEIWDEYGSLFVKVKDTGIGIEKERIDTIFEKFNQANNENYTKKGIHGTGLGLHLVRQILKLLSGEIRVVSTPKQGTEFTFYLPLSHDTHNA